MVKPIIFKFILSLFLIPSNGSTDCTKNERTKSNESTRWANLTDVLGPEYEKDDTVEL